MPFRATHMDVIIPAVQQLNDAGRAKGIPIVYTTTAYEDVAGPNSDMGLWVHKIPVELLEVGTEAVAIDDRIKPRPGELVIVKKRASGFHGTNLSSYLNAQGVDTVIITGVTMAGCVRHSTEDAIAEGFRPIVVREAVGDRVPGVVEWNLFDIDAKFGDVEPLSAVLEYLDGIEPFESRVGAPALASPSPMIVRDQGEAWQIVLQTDHADLSGAVRGGMGGSRAAARLGDRRRPAPRRRLGRLGALAARRRRRRAGRLPRRPRPAHLAFYRAGIAAITDEDPYAGLLVSMHGAGIYRQRYGSDTGLSLSRAAEVQPLVDAFVEEQESAYPERAAAARGRRRAPLGRLPPAAVVRPVLARVLPARMGRARRAPLRARPVHVHPARALAGAGRPVSVRRPVHPFHAAPPAAAQARAGRRPSSGRRSSTPSPRRSRSSSSPDDPRYGVSRRGSPPRARASRTPSRA